MKVLAIHDIHGNSDALDAMLGDRRAREADVMVVDGDAVPCALARQALDRLDGLAGPVRWVRDNGEREVAAAAAGRSGSASAGEDLAHRTAAVAARSSAPTGPVGSAS